MIDESAEILKRTLSDDKKEMLIELRYEQGGFGSFRFYFDKPFDEQTSRFDARCKEEFTQDNCTKQILLKGLFAFELEPLCIDFIEGTKIISEQVVIDGNPMKLTQINEGIFEESRLHAGTVRWLPKSAVDRDKIGLTVTENYISYSDDRMCVNYSETLPQEQGAEIRTGFIESSGSIVPEQPFQGKECLRITVVTEQDDAYEAQVSYRESTGTYVVSHDQDRPYFTHGVVNTYFPVNQQIGLMTTHGYYNRLQQLESPCRADGVVIDCMEMQFYWKNERRIFRYGLTGVFRQGLIASGFQHWKKNDAQRQGAESQFLYFGAFAPEPNQLSERKVMLQDVSGRLYYYCNHNKDYISMKVGFREGYSTEPSVEYNIACRTGRLHSITKKRTVAGGQSVIEWASVLDNDWFALDTSGARRITNTRKRRSIPLTPEIEQLHHEVIFDLYKSNIIAPCGFELITKRRMQQNKCAASFEQAASEMRESLLETDHAEKMQIAEARQQRQRAHRVTVLLQKEQKNREQQCVLSRNEQQERAEIERRYEDTWRSCMDLFAKERLHAQQQTERRLFSEQPVKDQDTQTNALRKKEKCMRHFKGMFTRTGLQFFSAEPGSQSVPLRLSYLARHHIHLEYSLAAAQCSINRWIGNLLDHGLFFYVAAQVIDHRTNYLTHYYLCLRQPLRKNHYAMGQAEKTVYELHKGMSSAPLLAERYNGKFLCLADCTDPFYGLPVHLQTGTYSLIETRWMKVYLVQNGALNEATFEEELPAVENFRERVVNTPRI